MLTTAVGAGAGDGIRLAAPQVVSGTELPDGSLSSDVSTITSGTGPVITAVAFVAGYGDSWPNNDQIRGHVRRGHRLRELAEREHRFRRHAGVQLTSSGTPTS